MPKVMFYSAVADEALFERAGFYRDDIRALSLRGDEVVATNRAFDVLRHRPQRIIGYFYSRALIVAVLGRLVGARVVLTGGADQIAPAATSGKRAIIHRIIAFSCLLFAHKILTTCREDEENFRALACGIGMLQRKVRRAPHAVVPPAVPRTAERDSEILRFVTLCWMGSEGNVRRKGVDRAVQLVVLLRGTGAKITLEIAGTDGPGRALLDAVVETCDAGDFVTFLGPISEARKADMFGRSHAYLQLSEYEGFGVAAAEAMLSGLVVVHSAKGGLADAVGDCGLVVPLDLAPLKDVGRARNLVNRIRNFRVSESDLAAKAHEFSLENRSRSLLDA